MAEISAEHKKTTVDQEFKAPTVNSVFVSYLLMLNVPWPFSGYSRRLLTVSSLFPNITMSTLAVALAEVLLIVYSNSPENLVLFILKMALLPPELTLATANLLSILQALFRFLKNVDNPVIKS